MLDRFRTTRWRIALWNAVGTAGITLATLIAVRQGVRWTIWHEVDEILAEDAREIDLALQEVRPENFAQLADELRRKSVGHRQHDWFVALWDESGRVRWQSERTDAGTFSAEAGPAAIPPSTSAARRHVRRVSPNLHGVTAIAVGASTRPLDRDLDRIDRLVALAGLSVVILAPAVGYLLAGRATRDVRLMSTLAERLQPAQLDQRLPLRGTDDEFDRLAHRINELLDRIAAYLSQRRDFLANAAHEMRSPLAAIRSSIEVALAKPRSIDEYCRLLEDVIEEGESLEILVNQILLLSEVQAATQEHAYQPVDFADVLQRGCEMFRAVAEASQVELTVEAPLATPVRGNRAHLRQIVNNLLDNAIKYVPPGSHVQVALVVDRAAGHAVLSVADDGPGIPAEDLPRIFERFFRVDRARPRDGVRGTGLGLSICKSIAESHGGTIRCVSEPGRGTVFTVELPLAPDPA
jgi:heavy metal sensor kinase